MKKSVLYSLAALAVAALGWWQGPHAYNHLTGNAHGDTQFLTMPMAFVGGREHTEDTHKLGTEDERRFFKNFVQQSTTFPTANYASYVTAVYGDGSTPFGGYGAASEQQPDIPSTFNKRSWLESTTSTPVNDGITAKFRTQCEYSHSDFVDPMLYPGKYPFAHLHSFFGNTGINPNSTYTSLRKTGGSTCAGGLLNRTAYWHPAVLKDNALGDGVTKIIKPNGILIYYVTDKTIADRDIITPIPRGLGYVTGFDPADPNDDYSSTILTAANVGNSGFSYSLNVVSNGFKGWECQGLNGSYIQGVQANGPWPHAVVAGSGSQPYLRNPDGTATLDCPTSVPILATINGPVCWDGDNLLSPNGRTHVFRGLRNNAGNVAGNGNHIEPCPSGWHRFVEIQLFFSFTHNGEADYKEWYLSSDRMTASQYIHADQPCHASNITAGIPGSYCNGQTFHTDWFGAWDYEIMQTWMTLCNGTTTKQGGTPVSRSCDDSQFGDGRKGIVLGPAPDRSRLNQTSNTNLTLSERYDDIPRGGATDGSP